MASCIFPVLLVTSYNSVTTLPLRNVVTLANPTPKELGILNYLCSCIIFDYEYYMVEMTSLVSVPRKGIEFYTSLDMH